MTWEKNIETLYSLLGSLTVSDSYGSYFGAEKGFEKWAKHTRFLRENKRTCFIIGNGASASMASHFAADLAKNGRVRTQVFTDLSLITAIGNDISYDKVFSEPLRWWMQEKDMLIAISSSGNSPNIVDGVKAAKESGGIVVTLSAMKEKNLIRSMGDLNFYIKADTYGLAESGHAAILHYWMDLMEKD